MRNIPEETSTEFIGKYFLISLRILILKWKGIYIYFQIKDDYFVNFTFYITNITVLNSIIVFCITPYCGLEFENNPLLNTITDYEKTGYTRQAQFYFIN